MLEKSIATFPLESGFWHGMISPRATANSAVGEEEYAAVLHTWLANRSLSCWTDAFAQDNLVTAKNRVKPSTFIHIAKLLEGFIGMGCSNCVIYPAKLERAVLKTMMKTQPTVDKVGTEALPRYAWSVTEHIKSHLTLLRDG